MLRTGLNTGRGECLPHLHVTKSLHQWDDLHALTFGKFLHR